VGTGNKISYMVQSNILRTGYHYTILLQTVYSSFFDDITTVIMRYVQRATITTEAKDDLKGVLVVIRQRTWV
jgi:hypothetical protein